MCLRKSRMPCSSPDHSTSNAAWCRMVAATTPSWGGGATGRPGERGGEVGEQPGPAEAAAADHHTVAAGLGDHGQRVGGRPDVAVAEHRDVRDTFALSSAMSAQAARPEYSCAAVRACSAIAAHPSSSAIRPASRNVRRRSSMPVRTLIVTGTSPAAAHRRGDDGSQETRAGRQRGTAAVARDLADRTAEVQVDVLGAVVADEEADGLADGARIGAVELDAARRLVGAEPGQLARSVVALDETPGRHHLADVQAGARGRGTSPGTGRW